MKRDEAIEAIRAVRHKISEEHQHDTKLLVRHYQEMDKLYAGRMLRGAGHGPVPAASRPRARSSPGR